MRLRRDELILIGVYVLGAIWLLLNVVFKVDIHVCPIKIVFGIPCPACGMTRAVELLLNGDCLGAFLMNPNILFIVLLTVAAPVLLLSRFVTNVDYIGILNKRLNRPSFMIPFFIFEIVIWIYNLYRGI